MTEQLSARKKDFVFHLEAKLFSCFNECTLLYAHMLVIVVLTTISS